MTRLLRMLATTPLFASILLFSVPTFCQSDSQTSGDSSCERLAKPFRRENQNGIT
jgi:hypothetical protein